MESSSRPPGATARPALAISAGASSRSSPRARRDVLPVFDSHSQEKPGNSSSLRTSVFYRSTPSFKNRKEARGVGALIGRWKSSCEFSRRFLPWVTLILVWFFIGYRLHISWSEGELRGVSGSRNDTSERFLNDIASKKMRLKGWLSIGGESGGQANGDGDPWIVTSHSQEDMGAEAEENPNIPLNEDDMEAMSEHTANKLGFHITNSDRPFGRVVGPFDHLEKRVFGTGGDIVKGRACSSQGRFPDFVRRKNFVVVFHELSMTGAPLALLELASKIVSCGGKVSAVVLNKRGGLYKELVQRGIMIVRDKYTYSYKAAARADLVIASSAACNVWIGQYLRHNRKGGERLIWWLMENRREYFERAKLLLGKPHALVFLSETQEQLWRQWAKEEEIVLSSTVKVVSLSVSDALAATAGLNDEAGSGSTGEAQNKREMLRDSVRKEMGLEPSDYLVISLSSINPGKGQLLMLQAALMLAEDVGDGGRMNLTQSVDETGAKIQLRESRKSKGTRNLKVLFGSVGSKSNKVEYLKRIHELITAHPSLAEMLLWTEATVHVTPLYAAADAYMMNAQGIGETFGRVTVEAMAFGLPVLGTDAGGTKEIVQGNITGLLHPAGQTGIPVLAQNLQWLLNNPEIGLEMGKRGRIRVNDVYREGPMYEAMASVFIDCVRERGG
ncbi:hypothetical protein KC19_6G064100 [Ceratodon purpureus]|uniref:Glycosyl transferase family 1 domain-containing protein n=1 Tax=Ceratodon purpureus TaxID=3225 RepID=A0A8T0HCT4_CERPU|nr:hypothetical protein KC19_6G064100 [Ceratodon purpureus]